MVFKNCVLVLCFFNLPLQSLHSPFYMALLEFWFGLILNFFIYFLIGNKSNIHHDEKRKKKKKKIHGVHDGEHKKKQHQRKNNSRDNSKSRKKLNDRKTIQRTPKEFVVIKLILGFLRNRNLSLYQNIISMTENLKMPTIFLSDKLL